MTVSIFLFRCLSSLLTHCHVRQTASQEPIVPWPTKAATIQSRDYIPPSFHFSSFSPEGMAAFIDITQGTLNNNPKAIARTDIEEATTQANHPAQQTTPLLHTPKADNNAHC